MPRTIPATIRPASSAASQHLQVAGDLILATADVRRFAAAGYLPLHAFCEGPELARIRAMLEPLFHCKVGYQEGSQFDMLGPDSDADAMTQPQILNPSQFAPALLTTQFFQRAAAVARQLLGPHAQYSFDHAIVKPAGSGRQTPWHQDEAHHANRVFRYRQISFWLALQDTPAESGCMHYIPNSHLNEILPHRNVDADPRRHAIECDPAAYDPSAAVIEPALAGTCIIHDGRTLHGAQANRSSRDRAAYILAFIGEPTLKQPTAGKAQEPQSAITPNRKRRLEWLRHGGWITVSLRRMRLGIRSHPAIFWIKARLIARAILTRIRAQNTD